MPDDITFSRGSFVRLLESLSPKADDTAPSVLAVSAVIRRVIEQHQLAEKIAGTRLAKTLLEEIRAHVEQLLESLCDSRPGQNPRSAWGSSGDDDRHPVGLLVAAVQFQKAADFT